MYNDALQRRQEGKITDAALAETLESDLLPPWQTQRQKLATASGLPRAEQQLVDLLGKFFELQEEKWLQLAKAIRNNDAQVAKQSQQQALEADQVA